MGPLKHNIFYLCLILKIFPSVNLTWSFFIHRHVGTLSVWICPPTHCMDAWQETKLSTGTSRSGAISVSCCYVMLCNPNFVSVGNILICVRQDMINCVGGLPVVFPILEQLSVMTPEQQAADPAAGSDFITPDVTTPADGDWVILPSNRASGLLHNQISKMKVKMKVQHITYYLYIFFQKHAWRRISWPPSCWCWSISYRGIQSIRRICFTHMVSLHWEPCCRRCLINLNFVI